LDAAQREPIVIRRQDRDVAVMMSPVEFNRLRGLNIAEFETLCDRIGQAAAAKGMSQKRLADILGE
jgi:PHD/YefM family antitoxin component YafN of YafNO toxin-antitoxin module